MEPIVRAAIIVSGAILMHAAATIFADALVARGTITSDVSMLWSALVLVCGLTVFFAGFLLKPNPADR